MFNWLLGKKRMLVCQNCDLRDGKWCLVCGCYLPLKTKVKIAKCPIGRW